MLEICLISSNPWLPIFITNLIRAVGVASGLLTGICWGGDQEAGGAFSLPSLLHLWVFVVEVVHHVISHLPGTTMPRDIPEQDRQRGWYPWF